MSLGLPCAAFAELFHARTGFGTEAAASGATPFLLLQRRRLRAAANGRVCCCCASVLPARLAAAAAAQAFIPGAAASPPAASRPRSIKDAAAAPAGYRREEGRQRQLLLATTAPALVALSSLTPLLLLLLLAQLSGSAAPLGAQAAGLSFSAAACSAQSLCPGSSSVRVRHGSSPASTCNSSRSQSLCGGHYATATTSFPPLTVPRAAAMALSCSLLQRSLLEGVSSSGLAAAAAAHTGGAAAGAAATAAGSLGAAVTQRALLSRAAAAPAAAALPANSSKKGLSALQQPALVSFLLVESRSAAGRCSPSTSVNRSCCSLRMGGRTRSDAFARCCSDRCRSFSSCSNEPGGSSSCSNSSSKSSAAPVQGSGVQLQHALNSSKRPASFFPFGAAQAIHYRTTPLPSASAAAAHLLRRHATAWFTPHSRSSTSALSSRALSSSSSSSNGVCGNSPAVAVTSSSDSNGAAPGHTTGRSSVSLCSNSSSSSFSLLDEQSASASFVPRSGEEKGAAERFWKRSKSERYAPTPYEVSQEEKEPETEGCRGAAEEAAAAAGAAATVRLPRSHGLIIDPASEAAIAAAASAAASGVAPPAAAAAAAARAACAAAGSRAVKGFAEDVEGRYLTGDPAAAAVDGYAGGLTGAPGAETAHLQQQHLYEAAAAHAPVSMQRLFNSVVKVYSDYTDPNYSLPWQMHRQGTSTGSGFVLRDRLIMTNAHCVSWNNRLQVRKHGSPNKYVARILAVGHECDLALITVDDEEFWKGDMAELDFGEVPSLQDAVVVLGYPRGGDNLCITSGVVSRVDVNPYAHSNTCLLCVQIDAAINPGNSGGPALKEGRVVGVAFQGFDNAQNIGYIVPTSVIQHFLEDVKRHRCYTGFPSAGILFQHLENRSMQAFLGMDRLKRADLPEGVEASGILVTMADELRPKQYLRMLEQRQKLREQQQQQQQKEGGGSGEAQQRQKNLQVDAKEGPGSSSDSSSVGCGSSSNFGAQREKWGACSSSAAGGAAARGAAEEASRRTEKKERKDEEEKTTKKKSLSETNGSKTETEQQPEEDLKTPEGVHVGLKKNDVILAIDGVDVANDGTVFFRDMERVNVSHTISSKFVGDTITATVLRKKKVLNVLVPLIHENALVPKHQWDMKARYLIYGGLVFCPLTLEYLKDEFGVKFNERAPSSLLQPLADIFAKEEGEEPVVLSHILASDLTSGYMFRNCLLTHVNGTKVLNMRHLAKLLGLKVPPPILESTTPVCDNAAVSKKPGGSPFRAVAAHGAADTTGAVALSIDSAAPVTDAAAAALLRAAAADAAVAAQCAQLQQQKKQHATEQQQSDKRENEFVIFLLEDKVQLVLERAKAESMQPYILKQHAICSPTSDVL